MRTQAATLFLLASLLGPASAQQPYGGTVYGVYPEGVMLTQGASSWLVPIQQGITFEVAGMRLNYTQLVPGQMVQATVPQPYISRVVTIPDAYAWHCKHHPEHPLGGPPGQMKKYNQGNGRGRH